MIMVRRNTYDIVMLDEHTGRIVWTTTHNDECWVNLVVQGQNFSRGSEKKALNIESKKIEKKDGEISSLEALL